MIGCRPEVLSQSLLLVPWLMLVQADATAAPPSGLDPILNDELATLPGPVPADANPSEPITRTQPSRTGPLVVKSIETDELALAEAA
jgi:hypothetical protein